MVSPWGSNGLILLLLSWWGILVFLGVCLKMHFCNWCHNFSSRLIFALLEYVPLGFFLLFAESVYGVIVLVLVVGFCWYHSASEFYDGIALQWTHLCVVTLWDWSTLVQVMVCFLMHQPLHYNENVILTTFSPLAAFEIVKMTTSNAGSDENFKMITFPFHSHWNHNDLSLTSFSPYSHDEEKRLLKPSFKWV